MSVSSLTRKMDFTDMGFYECKFIKISGSGGRLSAIFTATLVQVYTAK